MNNTITKLKIKIHETFLPLLRLILPVVRGLYRRAYQIDSLRLNQKLFSKVNHIPAEELDFVKAKIREAANSRKYDDYYREMWVMHGPRLILSRQWIAEAAKDWTGDRTGLDLGANSIASDLWKFWFPQVRWGNTDFDLRASWNIPPSSVDIILCTELVEHLPDVPDETFNETFKATGLKALLNEAWKALKPGGFLFLSTPNAASVLHVKAALEKRPPWFFDKHIREYLLDELLAPLRQTGFHIFRAEDVHCMSVYTYPDFIHIFEFLLANGYPTEGRGDDLFILAQKPV